ncbi:MAG: BspA family leucine-rich repeat surface protein [Lachnospiraceae bacterium]|nr:BspA family leucine-rich repeat surface protein [Lachnospiraceae bacterium]
MKTLNVSHFNTSKVDNMRLMFVGCESLQTLNVRNFNTSKVYDMTSMFGYCKNLQSLDLSSFNTSNVKDFSEMFLECSSLQSLDISSFSTAKAESMSQMFSGCSSLETLDLSSFSSSALTDISEMFVSCGSLETIYAASGADWSGVSEKEYTFSGCSSLKGAIPYDDSKISGEYAKVEDGYFTAKQTAPAEEGETSTWQNDWRYDLNESGGTISLIQYIGSGTEIEIPASAMVNGMSCSTVLRGTQSASESSFPKETQSISIEEGVRTAENADYLFSGMTEPISLDLSMLDTSGTASMIGMFAGSSGLQSLDISGFNTSSVTSMESMFSGCSSLQSLDLSGFDTSKVESFAHMFENCRSLASLDLSKFNTSSASDMAYMFRNCEGLETLDLSGFDTSKVKDFDRMFGNCGRLTSLDLSGFDTSSAVNMECMFYDCSSLQTVNLSVFNTTNVSNMKFMFANCGALKVLDVSSFNVSKVTDFQGMFSGCRSLKMIYAQPETDWSFIESKEDVFDGCLSLVGAIEYDAAKTSGDYAKTEEGYFSVRSDYDWKQWDYTLNASAGTVTLIKYKGSDTSIIIPAQAQIDDRFYAVILLGTNSGSDQTFPDGMTSISFEGGVQAASSVRYLFSGLGTLVNLDLGGFDTSRATDMREMFAGCSNLTELDLGGFGTYNVTDMYGMFSGCSSLQSVNISSFDTSRVSNMGEMFAGCGSLSNLAVSVLDTSDATSLQGMFSGCGSLGSVDLSGFNTANVRSMSSMFAGCANLTSLDISGLDTSSLSDISQMFSGCRSLQTLSALPDTDWSGASGKSETFSGCVSLSGDIPYDSSKTSGDYAKSDEGYFTAEKKKKDSLADWDYEVDEVARTATLIKFKGSENIISIPSAVMIKEKEYSVILKGTNAWYGNPTFPDETKIILIGKGVRAARDVSYLFYSLSKLRTLDISGLDTSGTVKMSWMFWGCSELRSLDVSGFDTANASDMQYMFAGCTNLSALDVSRFDTSNVTNMRGLFQNCADLAKLDVSRFSTGRVSNFSEMFAGCGRLKELDVSGFSTENMRTSAGMFSGCSSLKLLDLSSFSVFRLRNISSMFASCRSLDTIYVASYETDWSGVGINQGAFTGCLKLRGYDPAKTSGEYAKAAGGYFTEKPENPYVPIDVEFVSLGERVDFKTVYLGRPYGPMPLPEREGYIFQGWSLTDREEETAISIFVSADTVVFRSEGHRLYARWEKIPAVMKVFFQAGKGSLPEGEASKEVVEGQPYGFLPVPAYGEGSFLGWFDAEKDGYRITADSRVSEEKDHTLYAYYDTDQILLSLTFDPGEGSVSPAKKEVEYGKPYGELPVPEREGYVFYGWFFEGQEDTLPVTQRTIVEKSWPHSLHALWTKEGNPWLLSFYVEGKLYRQFKVADGQAPMTAPAEPTGSGVFAAWYDMGTGSVWDPSAPVFGNMRLDARFIPTGASEEALETGRSGKDSGLIISEGTDLYMVKGQSYTLPEKYADGRKIAWVSSDKGIVKISGKNKAKALKATDENAQSNASAGDNVRISDTEDIFTYVVHVADPYLGDQNGRITWKTWTMLPGERLSLSMQGFGALEGMYSIFWQSANPETARVDNGMITALSKGTASISAYVNGKAYTAKVKVADNRAIGKIEAGETVSLVPLQTVSLSFQDGFKVKNAVYTAADGEAQALLPLEKKGKVYAYQNNVAYITTAGKLTAIGVGTTTLTAKGSNGQERTFTVSVGEPEQGIVYLNAGKARSLKHYNVKAAKAKWSVLSDEGKVVRQFKNGKVTSEKGVSGKAVISCKYDPYHLEGVNGTGFTYTTAVCVEDVKLSTDVRVREVKAGSSYELVLGEGMERHLKTEGNFQPIVFESNKPLIAFVDEAGVVSARAKGKAALSAKVNGKTIKVTVKIE